MITNRQIAEAIAARLFLTGDHKRASRLVLEMDGGRFAGGWGIGPMTDRIEEELERLIPPRPSGDSNEAKRLDEIVAAMRDLNLMERGAWIARYRELHSLCGRFPIETGLADRPVTRFVENLQCELQLRTAELLLVQQERAENAEK